MSRGSSNNGEVLSWTNQDPRESQLFNSWGVLYRFQTAVGPDGLSTTTLFRALRKNKEERVARLEWAPNGGLGRAQIGKNTVSMLDLVQQDQRMHGARVFSAPDGMLYRWTPSASSRDVQLMDPNGNVVAIYRPTRPTRYQIGDVHGELHFFPQSGACTVVRPSYLVGSWNLSANFLLFPPSPLVRCIRP
ncbi:hypothetical protein PILCRDRAFT_811532 [Piloderma croceum F 1598]|uniref:DUF6593 domain-containing protein n=1 Tax=Piloderma croceum (strain F 1598) TaxID=765440 RepID=A0A0C3GH89_PILCF|nr:hypothetical protein PILCRDRAFT_811532 [Piloderma croceum F 1598]